MSKNEIPFEKYAKTELENAKKLKSRKDLKKILEETNNRKFGYLNDITMIAIDSYPDSKKNK